MSHKYRDDVDISYLHPEFQKLMKKFSDNGFDYMGIYMGFIRTKDMAYRKNPPNGFIVFPEDTEDPCASSITGHMYVIKHGTGKHGDGIYIYTSFAPQGEMEDRYRVGFIDDATMDLLVSDEAKKMYKQWIELRTREKKSWDKHEKAMKKYS